MASEEPGMSDELAAYVRDLEDRILEIENGLTWRVVVALQRLVPVHLRPVATKLGSLLSRGHANRAPSEPSSLATVGLDQAHLLSVLDTALDSPDRVLIDFTCDKPQASVVIPVFNNAHLTLECLTYLKNTRIPLEIIVVDDASTDKTAQLLTRIHGIRVLRNDTNLGYKDSCSLGMEAASGEYSLLLNNDVFVSPDSISSALALLESDDSVAAVCAKLLGLGGKIQECGSYVDSAGDSHGFLAGEPHDHPGSMHRRPVDYGSAAFLMVRNSLWMAVGGFGLDFNEAYYEDTELCFKFWEMGYKVIFEPLCSAVHIRNASYSARASRLIQDNKRVFLRMRSSELSERTGLSHYQLAHIRQFRTSVTYVDSRLPLERFGAGFPRSRRIVQFLEQLDIDLTVVSMEKMGKADVQEFKRSLSSESTEIIVLDDSELNLSHLRARLGKASICWVSRKQNLDYLLPEIRKIRSAKSLRLVYDSESLDFLRKSPSKYAEPEDPRRELRTKAGKQELARIRASDIAVVVGHQEFDLLIEEGEENIILLGYTPLAEAKLSPNTPATSQVFVGRLMDRDSPNWDSLNWFLNEIVPLASPGEIDLAVVGSVHPVIAKDLMKAGARIKGSVSDLSKEYASARILIAPTRFGSGIPIKVIDAVMGGLLPLVTPLLARQLGIPLDSKSVCKTPQEFISRLRDFQDDDLFESEYTKIAEIVHQRFGRSVFERQLSAVLRRAEI